MLKVLFLIMLFPLSSFATEDNKWGNIFSFEMAFGGDEIDSFNYSDGSKSSLTAGRGLYLGYGRSYTLNHSKKALSSLYGTIGWKFATIQEASNGDVSWSRFPLELGASYLYTPWSLRFATGFNYVPESSISASGAVSGSSAKMGSSAGYFAQLEYMLGYQMGFGLKMGFNDFENKDTNEKFSGDYIGVNFNFYWGKGIPAAKKDKVKTKKKRTKKLTPAQKKKLIEALKKRKKQKQQKKSATQ